MLSPAAHTGTPLQLKSIVIALVVVALVVVRRITPQRAKPWRAVSIAILVALSSLFGLLATGHIAQEGLALALAPIFLAAGVWLGLKLMSTVTFWRDERTGKLWMRGGIVYVLVWLGTLALRIGLRVLVARAGGAGLHGRGDFSGWMAVLSADPLFLSVGMWVGRAVAIIKKLREMAPQLETV